MKPEFSISLSGISKFYPGVVALDDVSLHVEAGEVVGLVGENGAGKSTLMKVLGGGVAPERGTIVINGEDYDSLTPSEAADLGIAFVHQELNLFDNLDVAANVYIGREPHGYGFLRLIDNAKLNGEVQSLLDRLGAAFFPTTSVAKLSLAQQQMVEIAKVLSVDARMVIFDEPTSSLPIAETEKLLEVIAGLKEHGIAVIFISHRLHEIVAACDRVVVLRDGRLAGSLQGDEIEHDAMVRLMVGRDLKVTYSPPAAPPGDAVLSARGIRTGTYPYKEIDLDLHSGEILGLAGLVGAGRTELARVLFGIDGLLGGVIRLDGEEIHFASSADAVKAGVFLVPEDRKGAGLLLDMTIAENISLPDLASYSRNFLVSREAERKRAERSRTDLDIRAPGVDIRTGALSGGNQQKVVLAKWLAMDPKVMIFDEPTRGIDIGAKAEIYRLMRNLADSGVAVLVISSDMEEVIGVSDRVAVMHEGGISGILDRAWANEENILSLAVGKPI
ncbi:MAG: sugar ABC transporter ATP-binding protein [Rhizobiaceae bacterium]